MSVRSAYRRPASSWVMVLPPETYWPVTMLKSRPQQPADAEPVVSVEIAVLMRDQGIDEVLRHLVDRDRLAVLLAEELRDLPVVDVQHLRGKRRVVVR